MIPLCNPLFRDFEFSAIRGFVFDCDGVLFDSREANIRYYNMIKKRLDLPPMDRAEEEYVHSHSVSDSVKRIVPSDLLPQAEVVRQELEYAEVLPWMEPEHGLYETLNTLRDLGFKMAINTNRTTTMNMLLDRYELDQYFFPVVTAAKVSMSKPHPESLHLILSYWNAIPGEIIYVGDSDVDERTALGAGVRFWSFKNPDLQAHMYVPDFWSMRQFILRQHNKGVFCA